MADHVQQQILEAVQTALVAAATAASTRVYLDRVDEIPQANLPAIDILGPDDTGEESIQYLAMHFPPVQQRSYTFAISSIAALATGSAKAARNLAKQVEAALLAAIGSITVGGSAVTCVTSIKLTLENGIENLPVVGETTRVRGAAGRSIVTGELTTLYQDDTLLDAFEDETETAIVFALTEGVAPYTLFIFPLNPYAAVVIGSRTSLIWL